MTRTEMVFNRLIHPPFNYLMWLLAPENCTEFNKLSCWNLLVFCTSSYDNKKSKMSVNKNI